MQKTFKKLCALSLGASIGITGLTTLTTAQDAFAAQSGPSVGWSDGKGSAGGKLSGSLSGIQYRYWQRAKEGGKKEGPGNVEAFSRAIKKQNDDAKQSVGNGAGVPNMATNREETITCYRNVQSKKDEKTGEMEFWGSKYYILKDKEQGWANEGESASLCAASAPSSILPGTSNKPGKLIAGAYQQDKYSEQSAGRFRQKTNPARNQDPRCNEGVASLNAKSKKEPLGTTPKGWTNPTPGGGISQSTPLHGGCLYKVGGFTGRLSGISKLTGGGESGAGMKCIRGWNFGKKLGDGKGSITANNYGPLQAKALAGTPWTNVENEGWDTVEVSAYGANPSWENCAEDKVKFEFDSDKLAKKGKRILPQGQLGRYQNMMYLYYDDPIVEVSEWGESGPNGVRIVGHNYSAASELLNLQQGCQTEYLKDSYTPDEAMSRDVKAETMTHYSVGEEIPARYVDVYIAGATKNGDNGKRTKLSYSMTDCMYKPDVVRDDYAYLCGIDAGGAGNTPTNEDGTIKVNAGVTPLHTTWQDPKQLYSASPQAIGGKQLADKDTGLVGNGSVSESSAMSDRLDITRSADPIYLRWNRPTVLVDPSNKGASKLKANEANLRVDKTLALVQRYNPSQGEPERSQPNGRPLENGSPWVDTPKAKSLLNNDSAHKDPTWYKNEVLKKGQRSEFITEDYVAPESMSTLIGVPAEKANPTVTKFNPDVYGNTPLDFRIHEPRKGEMITDISLAGTQSRPTSPASGQSAHPYSGRNTFGGPGAKLSVDSGLVESLDNSYNVFVLPKETQLQSGVASAWESNENKPQKLRSSAFVRGTFPTQVMRLKNVKPNGFNKVDFDFEQVSGKIDSTLMCISKPINVYSFKPNAS